MPNLPQYTTLEQMLEIAVNRQKITIGLPKPQGENNRFFPLTPEAAGMLVERGFIVKMERTGAEAIHYTDLRYQNLGVEITERAETFRCDLVLYMSSLSALDARMLKRGAMLLTMYDSAVADPYAMKHLLRNHVITIALDLIEDDMHHHPFADIMSEISGRAAMAVASSLLADAVHGKGILLGGIAGIVPCEVTIIGSGIDACAAASSALGLGALVRMFDNDIYRLRVAMHELGPGVSGSAMHPRVLVNALRSADVVVATKIQQKCLITSDIVEVMKLGVVTFDLDSAAGATFPSLRQVDLGMASPSDNSMDGRRVCYIRPGNAVPRTAAMALSNTFNTMITNVFESDGLQNSFMFNEGLQKAALTFLGKPVNADFARMVGVKHIDIKILLPYS